MNSILSRFFKIPNRLGFAPYGARHEGLDKKGSGYFGEIRNKNGDISTEVSAANNEYSYPLLVPTMPRKYIDDIVNGNELDEEVFKIAEEYAKWRRSQGLDPFHQGTELRYPLPEK